MLILLFVLLVTYMFIRINNCLISCTNESEIERTSYNTHDYCYSDLMIQDQIDQLNQQFQFQTDEYNRQALQMQIEEMNRQLEQINIDMSSQMAEEARLAATGIEFGGYDSSPAMNPEMSFDNDGFGGMF